MAIKFLNTVAVDTDVLYVDASSNNVGIGTTSPQTTLHLYDTEGSILRLSSDQHGDTNKIEFDATNLGAIYHSITSNTNSGNLQIRAGDGGSGHEVNIYTDGQFAATFDHNQRLGIGTTSPSQKLHVQGDTLIGGTSTTLTVGDLGSTRIQTSAGALTGYYGSSAPARFALGRDVFGGGAAGLALGGAGGYSYIGTDSTNGDKLIFSTNGSTTTGQGITYEKMRITETGRVGIGVTDPSEKLHVEGDIRLLDELIFGEYSTTTDRLTNQSYALTIAHSQAINFNVNASSVFNVYGTQIRPQVNNTVDLGHSGFRWKKGYFADNLIASSIGIGTDYPSDELTIEAENPTIRLKDISSSNYAEFYVNNFDTYLDSAGRTFIQSGGSTNVTITSAGNVGIGTTSPNQLLEVANSAGDATINISTDQSAGSQASKKYINLDFSGYNNNVMAKIQSWDESFSGGNGYLTFSTRNASSGLLSQAMVLDYDGNVGIGAASPSEKLDVAGDIASQGIYVDRTHESGGISNPFAKLGLHYFWGDSNSINLQKTGNNNKFTFSTQSGYLHVVNSSGAKVQIDSSEQSIKSALGTFNVGVAQHAAANNNQGNYISITNGGNTTGSRGVINVNGDLKINDYSTSSAIEKIKLKNDGSAYFAGNVGIGTTSPIRSLHLNSSSNNYIRLQTTGVNGYSGIEFQNDARTWTAGITNTDAFVLSGGAQFAGGYPFMIEAAAPNSSFIVKTSGNIGIGTTAPTAKLQIDSTSGWGLFTERGIKDGSTSTYSHNYSAGNAHILGRAMYFESSVVFSTSTADATTKEYRFSNASDKLTVKSLVSGNTFDDNILVLSGSNVGIGTASPLNKLQVSDGSVGIDSQYMIRDNRNNTILQQSANTVASNRSLTIGNATYSNVIIPNGNVGIGTTSPSSILHLKSDTSTLTLESSDTSLNSEQVWASLDFKQNDASQTPSGSVANISAVAKAGNTNFGNLLFQTKSRPSDTYNDTLFLSSSGNVGIGTTSPSEKLEIYGGNLIVNDGTSKSRLRPNDLYLQSSGTINAWIRANGVSYFNGGNVGIGTTAPSTPLHINADAPTIRLQDATSGDNHYLTANNGELRIQSTGYMTMRPGNAVSTTFLANGNVGIGTTSPSTALHIKSTSAGGGYATIENTVHLAKLQLKSATYTGSLVMDGTGGYISGGGLILDSGTHPKTQFLQGGVSKMIINNGDVGIGTASPGEKLDVDGNILADGLGIGNNTIYSNSINLNNAGSLRIGNAEFISKSSNDMSIFQSKMVVTSAGNVGIGTTSPSQKLDVAGNAIVRGDIVSRDTYPSIYVDHSGTVMGGIRADATTKLELKTLTTAPLSFQVNSSEKMLIQNNGNVGIGTNSPSQKLEVDGEVLSDGYRVSAMQTAPAARNSTGTLGEIRITSNYIYICYATNSWSRVALATSW